MRSCIYPSIPENRFNNKWAEMEPNTGTMFIKSSRNSVFILDSVFILVHIMYKMDIKYAYI